MNHSAHCYVTPGVCVCRIEIEKPYGIDREYEVHLVQVKAHGRAIHKVLDRMGVVMPRTNEERAMDGPRTIKEQLEEAGIGTPPRRRSGDYDNQFKEGTMGPEGQASTTQPQSVILAESISYNHDRAGHIYERLQRMTGDFAPETGAVVDEKNSPGGIMRDLIDKLQRSNNVLDRAVEELAKLM